MSYSSSLILPSLIHPSKADIASGGADNGSGWDLQSRASYPAGGDYLQTKISAFSGSASDSIFENKGY